MTAIDDVPILVERRKQWGDPTTTHERIADVWTGILGHHIDAVQVALMMAGLKLVRASINPAEPDSYDDGHGYLTIAQHIQEDN